MPTNYLEIIWMLAKTDFKLRYHGSILGYIWALLKPLMIFLVLNFVFEHIFSGETQHYSLSLLTGIVIWNFFAEGTMTGLTSLMNKAGIITKTAVPRLLIVLASTINVLMTYVLSLLILAIFFVLYGVIPPLLSIMLFLGICILVYGIIVAFSLLLAPVFLRLRDLNQVWEVLLIMGFYAAPIIYPLETLPLNVRFFLYFNPMTIFIQWSKEILIEGKIPSLATYFTLMAAIAVLLLVTLWIFKITSLRAAENI